MDDTNDNKVEMPIDVAEDLEERDNRIHKISNLVDAKESLHDLSEAVAGLWTVIYDMANGLANLENAISQSFSKKS